MKRRGVRAALVAALALLVPGSPAYAGDRDELTVSAAASLAEALNDLGRAYEASHAGVRVVFNFGASGHLLQQILAGAPVDVLVAADDDTMDRAQAAGVLVAAARTPIASNTLVLAVPATDTADPATLRDLASATFGRIGIGQPGTVPAGRYARDALVAAGLWETVQPRLVFGQSVRQVLDYIGRGEVDAGFVYRTDVAASGGRVRGALPVATAAPVRYAACALRGAQETASRAFVAFIVSPEGQAILARHGFGRP